MHTQAVEALICPACGLDFAAPTPKTHALECAGGHRFDTARQGYVNLLTGHGTRFRPDSAAMVEARDAFLQAGHYDRLAGRLADVVATELTDRTPPGRLPADRTPADRLPLLLDAGTGTGFYLRHILDRQDDLSAAVASVGVDISKFALRRAARRNPDTANLVWDIWQPLPVAAHTADVVVVVFAPRNAAEFARILRPGGLLLVVTPAPGHLAEIAALTGMLGIQPDKATALAASLDGHFMPAFDDELGFEMRLSPEDVAHVALMGPSGHHLDPVALDAVTGTLAELSPVTARFRISGFRVRPEWRPDRSALIGNARAGRWGRPHRRAAAASAGPRAAS